MKKYFVLFCFILTGNIFASLGQKTAPRHQRSRHTLSKEFPNPGRTFINILKNESLSGDHRTEELDNYLAKAPQSIVSVNKNESLTRAYIAYNKIMIRELRETKNNNTAKVQTEAAGNRNLAIIQSGINEDIFLGCFINKLKQLQKYLQQSLKHKKS